MPKITLISSDKVNFETTEEIIKCSDTIQIWIKDLVLDDVEDIQIPLPTIHSIILSKILKWANHHKDDPPSQPEDESIDRPIVFSAWDANFLQEDHGTLFALILAASALQITGLMSLTCKAIALMIIDKTPEQIRQMLYIPDE